MWPCMIKIKAKRRILHRTLLVDDPHLGILTSLCSRPIRDLL